MSVDLLIQAGALGVLLLLLGVIGKIVAPALKRFLDGLIQQLETLNKRSEQQNLVLDQIAKRLDDHEDLLKERRCIYRDRNGNPTEGVSGFPRRMAPSLPDGGE